MQTLLAVRLGIDMLIGLAFWGQMRRYPSIGGPGWWALSAVAAIVGSLGMLMRGFGPEVFTVAVANSMFTVGGLLAWMGLRSYLNFSRPTSRVVVASVAVVAAQLLFLQVWDLPPVRQLIFVLTTVAIMVLALRDMVRADPQRQVPELQALKLLTGVEATVLVGFAAAVPLGGISLEVAAPVTLFFFVLARLLRVMLYGTLLSHRLRQEGDRARQGLQAREANSRALIDNLSAGVMVFRPDHTLSSINSAARCFLGWSEGGANSALPEPTMAAWNMLREDGQPMRRHEMPFERVLATGLPVRSVIVGVPVMQAGEVRWALCNAYPELTSQGALRHVVVTFIDITSLREVQAQQKRLQAQLAQSQKMEALGTLAGGVAHDFNNILAAILGNADLARQDLAPDASSRESLHEISTAARRGRELVRQILAFSRQQPAERTPVRVGDIATESCTLLRAALPSQVQLLLECQPDTPLILADATQMGQVLINLGTNAVHAMHGRPGRVSYLVDRVAHDDPRLPREVAQACAQVGADAARVRVQDTGCGMAEDVLQRIFEPFFTTKSSGQGTGLGLAVVLGIVQMHGGDIDVSSQPGQGTTFTLYFPGASPSATASADAFTMVATTPAHGETLSTETIPMAEDAAHILYLDDDDTLVFLVRRLLERRGYRVTAFTDQRQAIEAVRADPQGFHLLLTDYNMPGMSGLDVARAVLELSPALPVAVASGYITDELQAEARAAGVREVVFKTDAVEAFCEIVARLIRPA
ncbi:ATP-binding protein [Hydrogenophaga sp.]|uniref:hybrid sensor histidine kinase/response regulator n=1 Tax=Hydrogenophaga sp. TaxID=1904254 RepID=UPI0026388E90|nr:ATP-binding protein [Hydrogenophaga sp.]MCW5655790.1 response regulator [Hydrogenophaga sp.]